MPENRFASFIARPAALLCVAFLAASTGMDTASGGAADVEDRIEELRRGGHFEAALALAESLLVTRSTDSTASTHEIDDARRLVGTLRDVVALPRQTQDELAAAERLEATIDSLWDASAYYRGESVAARKVEVQRRILGPRHPDVSASLSYLGWLQRRAGDLTDAKESFREVLDIDRETLGDDHPDIATDLSNLAGVLGLLGDYEMADRYFHEALRRTRDLYGDDDLEVATTLNNYASLLKRRGDVAHAEVFLREALRIRREKLGADHWGVATVLNNLADLLVSKGDLASAEPLYDESLTIYRRRNPTHKNVGIALNNLGNVYRERGDFAHAESFYREALDVYEARAGDGHADYAVCLGNLALTLEGRGNLVDAEPLHLRSLAILRARYGSAHVAVAVEMNNLAQNLRRRGQLEEAEELSRDALAVNRRLLGDAHPSVLNSLVGLSRVRIARGDYVGAETLLVSAARVFDAARLRVGTGLERATFRDSPYRLLAAVRLELGERTAAWEAVEQDLARVLSDVLDAARDSTLTSDERRRDLALRKDITTAESAVATLALRARDDSTGAVDSVLAAARNRLLSVEAQWIELQSDIASRLRPRGSADSLAGVQSALDSETAVIGWLDVETSDDEAAAWVYVIRDTGSVQWERLEGAGPTSVRLFRDGLMSAGGLQLGVRSHAERLWRERVEPATRALAGARRLVVIPSGLMMGVPIEALRDGAGRFLADRYDVSYAPAATIRRPPTRRTGTRRVLLVGDPLFPPEGLRPLPASRDEVNEIAVVVPNSTVLLGADASEQRLCELVDSGALEEFDVIHLATHALADNDRPGRSALALTLVDLPDPLEAARSGARVYDGWLSASEITREWKLDADLVVLSACETALGKEVGGEGYVGLAHAFLQVGARGVVVSLWKVDDTATALLMRRFYQNLFGGRAMPAPRALAQAKRWLRSYENPRGERPYEHPFYWSSFVLIELGR